MLLSWKKPMLCPWKMPLRFLQMLLKIPLMFLHEKSEGRVHFLLEVAAMSSSTHSSIAVPCPLLGTLGRSTIHPLAQRLKGFSFWPSNSWCQQRVECRILLLPPLLLGPQPFLSSAMFQNFSPPTLGSYFKSRVLLLCETSSPQFDKFSSTSSWLSSICANTHIQFLFTITPCFLYSYIYLFSFF